MIEKIFLIITCIGFVCSCATSDIDAPKETRVTSPVHLSKYDNISVLAVGIEGTYITKPSSLTALNKIEIVFRRELQTKTNKATVGLSFEQAVIKSGIIIKPFIEIMEPSAVLMKVSFIEYPGAKQVHSTYLYHTSGKHGGRFSSGDHAGDRFDDEMLLNMGRDLAEYIYESL